MIDLIDRGCAHFTATAWILIFLPSVLRIIIILRQDEAPEAFQQKTEKTLQYLEYLQGVAQPARDLFDDPAKVAVLEEEGGISDLNIARVGPRLGIGVENVQKLYVRMVALSSSSVLAIAAL